MKTTKNNTQNKFTLDFLSKYSNNLKYSVKTLEGVEIKNENIYDTLCKKVTSVNICFTMYESEKLLTIHSQLLQSYRLCISSMVRFWPSTTIHTPLITPILK